jgi:hypothetical protein
MRTLRQQEAKVRGFAAINRVRRGQSKTLSAAARAEHTTVRSIRQHLPAALMQGRPGRRIRVKAGDPYSQLVGIITDSGLLDAKARGSRQRLLAGRHRSVVNKVLEGELPPNALDQFRGVQVGGHELLSDADRLFTLATAGVLSQLDALYVSPETHA